MPIFFVLMGVRVDLSSFGQVEVLGFAALLSLAAIVGKMICAGGVVEKGLDRISVAVGMVPRGEVGLIFAGIGAQLVLHGERVIPPPVFAAVVVMVIVTTLNIEFGSSGGEMHICIPWTSLEPLRDLLYSAMQADTRETDKRWAKQLQREVQNAEVELIVKLGQTAVTLEQILNMQAGDVIGINVPESMLAEVDGVPVLECRCGVSNGQYAVRVERIVSHAEES